jgi:drug/metabolite transporter (DMT)-like permease
LPWRYGAAALGRADADRNAAMVGHSGAAGLVLGLSSAAPLTGPYLAGLFATFPVFATVLTIFAHRLEGEPAARQVLRGLLLGLFGFAGFFALLAYALQTIGVAAAFTAAASTAVGIQGCSLRVVQRSA